MLINLKSLNESLERLSESNLPLNERFDDSFPKWLKDRLVTVKNSHSGFNKAKGIPYQERPDYINARNERTWDPKSMSLFNKALDKGIDLTNVKVIEGPIPVKRTDERLKEPNIPIWLFEVPYSEMVNGERVQKKYNQVYIEGVNDNEVYRPMDRAFKYIPMKYKMEDAKAFAYIDGSKIDPNAIASKRLDREDHAKELKEIGYGRRGKDPDKFSKPSYYGTVDKSGYLIDPNRYKKKLDELKAKSIYVELEKFHDRLEDLKYKSQDAYASIDTFNTTDMINIKELMYCLIDAVENYNRYCRRVEDITNAGYSEDYKLKELGNIVRQLREDSRIKEAERRGADIFLSDIDWD